MASSLFEWRNEFFKTVTIFSICCSMIQWYVKFLQILRVFNIQFIIYVPLENEKQDVENLIAVWIVRAGWWVKTSWKLNNSCSCEVVWNSWVTEWEVGASSWMNISGKFQCTSYSIDVLWTIRIVRTSSWRDSGWVSLSKGNVSWESSSIVDRVTRFWINKMITKREVWASCRWYSSWILNSCWGDKPKDGRKNY